MRKFVYIKSGMKELIDRVANDIANEKSETVAALQFAIDSYQGNKGPGQWFVEQDVAREHVAAGVCLCYHYPAFEPVEDVWFSLSEKYSEPDYWYDLHPASKKTEDVCAFKSFGGHAIIKAASCVIIDEFCGLDVPGQSSPRADYATVRLKVTKPLKIPGLRYTVVFEDEDPDQASLF